MAIVASQHLKTALILAGIGLAVTVCFLPALDGSITTWDDNVHLSENPTVHSLSAANLGEIFTGTVNRTYIPLTLLSFALEYKIVGDHPFLYHLDNLLLHLAVTGLIFGLLRRMGATPETAGLAALIFGIHPMHVESVAWVTERKDVLYAFFYLLSLHAYWSYVQGHRRPLTYGLALLLATLSILAKPMALSLPLILLLMDWWQKGDRALFRRPLLRLLEKIPFLAVTAGVAGATYLLHARIPGDKDPLSALLIWNWTLIFYLRQFLFPAKLIPVYGLPQPVLLFSPHYFIPLLVTAGLVWALIHWRRKRLWIFSCAYFFLSIFFLLRFDDVLDTNIVADRFMYLPSLGFCWLLGEGIFRACRWCQQRSAFAGRTAVIVTCATFVLLGGLTFKQTQIWKTSRRMWSYVLQTRPDSYRAHYGLGQEYFRQGDIEQARQHYLAALRLKPDHPGAHNNLGDVLYREGRVSEALQHFATAVQLQPDNAAAHNNYGTLLARLDRYDEAVSHIETAIRLEPEQMLLQISLGDVYLGQGKVAAARQQYQNVLQARPRHPIAHNRLGILALKTRDWQTAVSHFQAALKADPDYETARHNLGIARFRAATQNEK